MKRKLSLGFTLFELLVVISIIGILLAVGAASYSAAQKRSRDARRKEDIRLMQNAFEQYAAANNGAYASPCNTIGTTYLPSGQPVDPKNSGSYVYSFTCASASYCFCAHLENTGTGNASNNSCTYATGDYFCLSNLQ